MQAHHMQQPQIELKQISKSYRFHGQSLKVIQNLDLQIHRGEIVAIVGPSGSGKTTLLRILAGLESFDQGDALIHGETIHDHNQQRAVIFQEPRLLPWLSVQENVQFGLEVQGNHASTRIKQHADDAIQLVGLTQFRHALPKQLSGGMAQRVGIARALAVQPEILLLDEPFGALDALTKISMQEELAKIGSEKQLTMVLVTHDLEEAIYLADRVIVFPQHKGDAIRTVHVDLPRPRVRSHPDFVRLRQQLLADFGLH